MKTEESAIIELFEQDREAAFEKMFRRYFKPLCVMGSYYTGDMSEAEDITQQLFIRFWTENWQVKVNVSLESFLKVSIRNACINHLEKEATLKRKISKAPQEKLAEQAFDFLVDEDQRRWIEKILSQLPPKGRRAFELVYLEDESYAKAAEIMSISVNTLKSHLKSTLNNLRSNDLLREYHERKKMG